MKKWIKLIQAGISGKLNEATNKYDFTVDFNNNSSEDVIQFIEPYFFESSINDDVFWFGYKFNDGVDSKLRKEFIEFMKDVKTEIWDDPEDEWSETYFEQGGISESDLNTMIIRSLKNAGLQNYDIDLIVCPESKGKLVSEIVKCTSNYLSTNRTIPSEILVKSDPSDIKFDIEKCLDDIEDNKIRVPHYVDEPYLKEIEHKIKTADRFSMRKLVYPPVLRKYVTGIFRIPLLKPLETAESILVIDDFKTSGTTIQQMVSSIRKVNPETIIYIFTLFGKTGKL